jgi:hypothetical protein
LDTWTPPVPLNVNAFGVPGWLAIGAISGA